MSLDKIAEIIGISRQALRKQVLAHKDFPRPVHCGNPTLWHLAPVLEWLQQTGKYDLEPALLDIARFNMQLNAQQQLHQVQEQGCPQAAIA